jgi:hypothetical protein
MTDKEILLRALCRDHLDLDVADDYDAMVFAEVDSFVAQSQGNTSIKHMRLHPHDVDPGNYELWDKVGQGVGNLESLGVVSIYIGNGLPDWEILARILPHIQNKIELRIDGGRIQGIEGMRAFARRIQGHPAITHLKADVSFEGTATLCSALNTLPNLESAVLWQQRSDREEVPTFQQSPESMTEFLRAPSLRIVEFRHFCFTGSLCQATAIALRQGSSITSLDLYRCSFPEGGSEHIASALKENAALTTFDIRPNPDTSIHQAFYDAMATSLQSNSTLQELSIISYGRTSPIRVCLSSLLLALGRNRTLRKLHISGLSSVAESVIPALHEGLGKNSTLETLALIQSGSYVTEPAFRIAIVGEHLTSIVKKNYRLESLIFLDAWDDRTGDLRSILRLNRAGRRYLLDGHGSVVSKGVDVLCAVSDDVNCVFLHLLENPSLCN